jgi:hypothetical protein
MFFKHLLWRKLNVPAYIDVSDPLLVPSGGKKFFLGRKTGNFGML